MNFDQDQIEFSIKQIARIDSGEGHFFLENVNTKNQVKAKIFGVTTRMGIFFSCLYCNNLRISIAFEEDINDFNEEVALLVNSSMKKVNVKSCTIWIRNENKKIIEYLKDKFHTASEGKHYYASTEYIMRRSHFNYAEDNIILEIKPYEEEWIDEYLLLLDESMTFVSPPPNYRCRKGVYLQEFAEYKRKDSFEAFWMKDELVGLYWRKNSEIDTIAVADQHQRKGYGSVILTRAINMALQNTEDEFAYLYVVDWNHKGRSFYKKYGMEPNGHSYLLRINDYLV